MGREKPVMEFLSKFTTLLFLLGVAAAIDANSEELYGEEYGSSEYGSSEYEYGDDFNSEYEKYIENLIEESENGTDRAIGTFTTGPYAEQFTEESKLLLKSYNLLHKTMVRDDTLGMSRETIKWSQFTDVTGATALRATSGTLIIRTETQAILQ